MLLYSSLQLLSSLLPLQPPLASTTALAGDCTLGLCTWVGSTGTSNHRFPCPYWKNAHKRHTNSSDLPESTLFTLQGAGIFRKRGNIHYANVSSWHTWTGADFADEMSVSPGGIGSVMDNTRPPICVSMLPCLSSMLGAACHGSAHPGLLRCLLGHELCSSADSLTQFHFCMT